MGVVAVIAAVLAAAFAAWKVITRAKPEPQPAPTPTPDPDPTPDPTPEPEPTPDPTPEPEPTPDPTPPPSTPKVELKANYSTARMSKGEVIDLSLYADGKKTPITRGVLSVFGVVSMKFNVDMLRITGLAAGSVEINAWDAQEHTAKLTATVIGAAPRPEPTPDPTPDPGPTPDPIPVPTPGVRSLRKPHIRLRVIQRWKGAEDDAFANEHFDDIDGGTLDTHPNAITVQHYALLLYQESNFENGFHLNNALYGDDIDADSSLDAVLASPDLSGSWSLPTDDAAHAVIWGEFAREWAQSHVEDVEDYYLHALPGQKNNVTDIWSISPDGTVVFSKYVGSGVQMASFPFHVGQQVTLAGLSQGNGVYTITELQKNGVTLADWGVTTPLGSGSVGTSKIGQLFTLGTGEKTPENRVSRWGWASWSEATSFRAPGARAMQVARFAQMLKGQQNCVLIDSMSTGDYNAHTVSQEYGNAQPSQQYVSDVAETLLAIRAAGGAAPKYLRINLAGYWQANDALLARAAGGVHHETALTLFPYDQSSLNFVIARVGESVDMEYSNGATYTVANGIAIMGGLPKSYNAGNYPRPTERAQMSLYALWLMAADATFKAVDGSLQKHCILDLTNGFSPNPPQSLVALIPKCLFYDIGQPIGKMTQLQRADPSGQQVRTLARAFSADGGATLSALAVFNHNVNGQTNYGDDSLVTTALPTPPAGKVWRMLKADGTLSLTVLTSIAARRSEGVIAVAVPQ